MLAFIITNLGRTSPKCKAREHKPIKMPELRPDPVAARPEARRVTGADVFVETGLLPAQLSPRLEQASEGTQLKLKVVSNRGTRFYPDKGTMIDCVDQYRCRFVLREAGGELADAHLTGLLARVGGKFRRMHVEKLQEFDDQPGYTKAQGEG